MAARPCGGPGAARDILKETTGATAVALDLPPSPEEEHYVFRVEAWKDGRLVGDLYTHDGGTHSWNYRFRVVDASLPRWVYPAAGAAVALLLAGVYAALLHGEAGRRRRRARLLALAAALVVGAVGAGVHHYRRDLEHQRAQAERVAADVRRQARQRELIAVFASAAPRPDWWDRVETPYRVDSLGDLLSAWQGHPRGDEGERQFFKAAYQGILDHPDDPHIVASAVNLLHWVVRDYPHRVALARFGYEHYLGHRARTDNCANCMVGDTSQGLAQNFGRLYAEATRYDEAIGVGRRLIEERGADVSPYKLAETWDQIAQAYWSKGERERAVDTVRAALARYGDTVRGDDLRRTLARFEAEGAKPPAPR